MHLPHITKRGREIAAADAFVSAGDRAAKLGRYELAAQSYDNALRALSPYKGSRGVDPRVTAIQERAMEARRRSQPITPPPIPLLPAPVTPLPDIYSGHGSGEAPGPVAVPADTGRDGEDTLYTPIGRDTNRWENPDYIAINKINDAIERLKIARQEGADVTVAEDHLRTARQDLHSGDYESAVTYARKAYNLAVESESRARAERDELGAVPPEDDSDGRLPDYLGGVARGSFLPPGTEELVEDIRGLGDFDDPERGAASSLVTGVYRSRSPEEAGYYFDLARDFVDTVRRKRGERAGPGRKVVDAVKEANPGRADEQGNIISDSTVGTEYTGQQPGDPEMEARLEREAEAARRERTAELLEQMKQRSKTGNPGTVSTGPGEVVISGAVLDKGKQVTSDADRARILRELGLGLEKD